MTRRISRHEMLREEEAPSPDAPATAPRACPCCADPLAPDQVCVQCGYPRNNAAWVDYDGCC